MENGDERQANLNRRMLEVTQYDFETIDSILNGASRFDAGTLWLWSVCEIKTALLTLVMDGLLAACIIHAEPPYVTTAVPNLDTLERYWFTITDRSVQFLQHEGSGGLDGL